MQQNQTSYFSDDITLLPSSAIWQASRMSGLLAPLMFGFFWFRKLLHLPFRAKFGATFPDVLPIRTIEELPPEARDAFARRFGELHEHGFTLQFCTVTQFIGCKWGASAIFLNAEGDLYASIVWLRIKLGAFDRAETTLSCHANLESNLILNTSAARNHITIPEMIPPGVSITRLPETTPFAELLRIHRQSISNSNSRPVRMDVAALQTHVLSTMQRLYDHLIAKKLYRRLTEAEVASLLANPPK
jgi:hypothetical protein